jgi:hypothetical protein
MSVDYFNRIVDFKRPKIDDYVIRGYVLEYSDSLTLINAPDENPTSPGTVHLTN